MLLVFLGLLRDEDVVCVVECVLGHRVEAVRVHTTDGATMYMDLCERVTMSD